MKNTITYYALSFTRINKVYLRFALMLLILILLVLGAVAPEDVGDHTN
jgi:hypothetical protein